MKSDRPERMPLHFPNLFSSGSSIGLADILKAMQQRDMTVLARHDYDLNVVGVRRMQFKANAFNDVLIAFYPYEGQWQYQKFQITTYPGMTYLKDRLLNDAGTAILVPGQYLDKYTVRKHDGKYQALCQKEDKNVFVDVFRDPALDGRPQMDMSTIDREARGINIHRANATDCTVAVDGFSAGCQVFRCAAQFDAFMALVRKARALNGNSFTYTLLTDDML